MASNEEKLKRLLRQVRQGAVTPPEAYARLKDLPFKNLGFARLDCHRSLRKGFPEAIYCEGKTAGQIERIVEHFLAGEELLLLTRAGEECYSRLRRKYPQLKYNPSARIVYWQRKKSAPAGKEILVVSAGTSDIPVAEEAALTAQLLSNRVTRLYDVGVAGVHRLLAHREKLARANVLIVVAGMEGALPSVIAGLTDRPIVAVPTSVGYGASFAGMAALLTMLNCCAPGVAVVNIDNGYGAGCFASMINKMKK